MNSGSLVLRRSENGINTHFNGALFDILAALKVEGPDSLSGFNFARISNTDIAIFSQGMPCHAK
jgi:hypothetical protein